MKKIDNNLNKWDKFTNKKNKNLIQKALSANDDKTKNLVPQTLFSDTHLFFDKNGELCVKLTKDDFVFWKKNIKKIIKYYAQSNTNN